MPPLPLRFLTSAPDVAKLPPTEAEVALIGRSNVGKSSLVNALANRRNLAHTSKTPGRTQLLNCFECGPGWTLVDCPGYGFAHAPARVRAAWARMIENYLHRRDELRMLLVLVDGEIGPTRLDVETLDWLDELGLPVAVVATKHDKVRASHRGKRSRELAEKCGLDPADVYWVSAAKGTGIDELRSAILRWLAGAPPV